MSVLQKYLGATRKFERYYSSWQEKQEKKLEAASSSCCLFFTIGSCSFFTGVSEHELIFCESVDKDLNPVNQGDDITTGDIKMLLRSSSSLDTSSVQIDIYWIHNSSEELMDRVQEGIDPEWDTVTHPLTFFGPGKYKVIVSDAEGDVVTKSTVRIK